MSHFSASAVTEGCLSTVLALALLLSSCGKQGDHSAPNPDARATGAEPESEVEPALDALRKLETARRAETSFTEQASFDRISGPNPYRIERHPSGALIGLLRGASRISVLGATLNEVGGAETLTSPTSLAINAAGDTFVSSDLEPQLDVLRLHDGKIDSIHRFDLPLGARLRAIASGEGSLLYGLDDEHDQLLLLEVAPRARRLEVLQSLPLPKGALSLQRLDHYLLVDCLLDHSLTIYALDPAGRILAPGLARIRHDGPIWSFTGLPTAEGLLVALGGVEDHPLDRTIGSFGYVDSFLYVYRVQGQRAERLQAVNLSELGVVTPKTLVASPTDDGFRLEVSGYGGWNAATLDFDRAARLTATQTVPLPPGTAARVDLGDRHVYANPLLDAWVEVAGSKTRVVPIVGYDPAFTREQPANLAPEDTGNPRLGEALLFTYLMAPHNSATGALSRFTCETCHFEGTIDGRTHHTGRGDVHATTKPLLGLFNNLPYFSRALDRDLTQVVNNEFRVAGAGSGTNPWFDIDLRDYPWLEYLGVHQPHISAAELRASLLDFLMDLSETPNPHSLGRTALTSEEQMGSAVFAARCESCHQARLVTNVAESRQPPARWPELILGESDALVWASNDYQKTGVTPYVHEQGARVPSLRRVYRKYPYFTNGSAKTLNDVLERVRFGESGFFHDQAPETQVLSSLSTPERQSLLAFLQLL